MGLKNIIAATATAVTVTTDVKTLLAGLNPEQEAAVVFGEGPILVAAVAGAGKCVTGDTIVATPLGPRRIDECKEIGMVSHSIDAMTLSANDAPGTWLDMGVSPVIEIETSNGFKIKGTPEHPLLVWRGEPVWTRLDQLAPEDLLMLRPGYGDNEGKQAIDPEEAYLLGLMMGDGWTCRREARDKHVPQWLIGASPAERVRFLQGYFDTDGSVSGHEVEVVSASEHLARDVHQMLLALGVVSRLSPKSVKGYDHTYWRITISGDQLRLFTVLVGFRYEQDKANTLQAIFDMPTNPNKGCYPMTGNLLSSLKEQWVSMGRWDGRRQSLDGKTIKDYLHGRRSPSKAKLLSMIDGCTGPVSDMLHNLIGFYLDPIVSINDAGSEHVYDFTVPTTHSFIANGIVSHNTRALIHRVAYLVAARKVNPARILAVTFSKAGADEMNDRLEKMLPGSGARIGTFHSVAYEILRSEVPGITGWTVCGDEKFRYCVKDAAGFRELDWKQCDVTLTCNFIGFCKSNMARPFSDDAMNIARERYYYKHGPKADPTMLNRVYERADQIRRDRELLTFDDMMLDAAELLRDNEPVRKRWAQRWDWVLQDEAQDQNKVQLVMGELLAKDHRNYLLVGDPAQAIYAWRGAMPSMLLSFEERWDAEVVKMSRNYRCGQTIIDTANRVLNSMDPSTKLDMNMICEKGTQGEVLCRQYANLDDEAEAIGAEIAALLEDGSQPKDIAILFRTNAQSRAPEEALIGRRIPYMVVGGTNFYNRKEVKDLLAYLRIADGRSSLDDVKRCINAPFRYLGAAFVKKVQDVAKKARAQAKKQGKRVHWPSVVREACNQGNVQYRQRNSAEEWSNLLSDAMERIQLQGEAERGSEQWDAGKPVNVLEDLVLATRYTDWLVRDEGEETTENSRVSNVRELIRAARRFPTVKELLDFIDDLTEASKRAQKGDKPNKVILTTIHRSKGLEWENVFLTGANEYILPHARSEDIDEERRLFYVGVTRAKERLAISCVAEIAVGDRVRPAFPSPFIAKAGLEPVFMVRDEVDAEKVPTLRTDEPDLTEPKGDSPLFEDLSDDDDFTPAPNAPFLN